MKRPSAFTLIEMLVVISIIAVLAAFAVPALTSALTRGQMTGTLNNGHQLYLAAQQMALDGTTNGDGSLGWPGDITGPVTTLVKYCDLLVQNNYIGGNDLQKILSAPSMACAITGGTYDTGTPPAYTPISVVKDPAMKIAIVQDKNPASTVFAYTANYTYNKALSPTGAPFADKGFVVQRKGGDAAILRQANATGTNIQKTVGLLPGDILGGTPSDETAGTNVLKN